MIRDVVFKAICLPLLGVLIPFGAHLFCCPQPAAMQIVYTLVFFSFFSLLLWQSVVRLVGFTHGRRWLPGSFAHRLLAVCVLAAAGAFIAAALAAYLWQQWMLPGAAQRLVSPPFGARSHSLAAELAGVALRWPGSPFRISVASFVASLASVVRSAQAVSIRRPACLRSAIVLAVPTRAPLRESGLRAPQQPNHAIIRHSQSFKSVASVRCA